MRLINYIKQRWASWIYFLLCFFFVFFFSDFYNSVFSDFLKYALSALLIGMVILSAIYYSNLLAIEENLWGDFKECEDRNIDRLVKNINTCSWILILLSIFWLGMMCCIFFRSSTNFPFSKFFYILVLPLVLNGLSFFQNYKMKKEYKKTNP